MADPLSHPGAGTIRQYLLVIIPLVTFVAFGLVVVKRDYARTEQEARQEAEGLARRLVLELGSRLAWELSNYRLAAGELHQALQAEASWPNADPPSSQSAQDDHSTTIDWESWHATNYPNILFSTACPVTVDLASESSRFLRGPLSPPMPPAWRLALNQTQQDLWNGFQQSGLSTTQLEELRAKLLATGPPEGLLRNLEWIQLTTTLETLPQPDRESRVLDFAEASPLAVSDSGLPLASIAVVRVLSLATELNKRLYDGIRTELHERPSLLSGFILARTSELSASQSPQIQNAVSALVRNWTASQGSYTLADQARTLMPSTGPVITNFWMSTDHGYWLAMVYPSDSRNQPTSASLGDRTSRRPLQLSLFAEDLVRSAVERNLSTPSFRHPPYFGLSISVGERTVFPRVPDLNDAVLVRQTGVLGGNVPDAPGIASISIPVDATFMAGTPGSDAAPQLSCDVRLTDPSLLYAEARNRALLLSGIILLAAGAAGFGLRASHRSYQRQLELNRLQSNFVSSVSHELRAPLGAVQLMAESLHRGKVVDPAEQSEFFRLIIQECRRLGSLVENVLDFSRLGQGRKQLEFEPTDITRLVRETVEVMQLHAADRRVTLELNPMPPELIDLDPPPCLDGKAVQQALINLLDNAIKHSTHGQTVTVSLSLATPTTETHAWLNIAVEDRGEGIPAAEQDQIFDPFYRLGSELNRRTKGVGIGLHLVKHTVEAHGGQVSVTSTVGEGSRFVMELPMPPERQSSAQVRP